MNVSTQPIFRWDYLSDCSLRAAFLCCEAKSQRKGGCGRPIETETSSRWQTGCCPEEQRTGEDVCTCRVDLRPSSSKGSNAIVTKQKLRRSRDLEKLLANGPRNVSLNLDDPVPTCQTGCPGRWGRVGGGRPLPRKQNWLPRSRKASGGASCSARRPSSGDEPECR